MSFRTFAATAYSAPAIVPAPVPEAQAPTLALVPPPEPAPEQPSWGTSGPVAQCMGDCSAPVAPAWTKVAAPTVEDFMLDGSGRPQNTVSPSDAAAWDDSRPVAVEADHKWIFIAALVLGVYLISEA